MGILNWLFEKPRRNYFDNISSDDGAEPPKEGFDNAASAPKRTDINIMNIRVGDYVTFRSVDYYVRQRYLYKAGAYGWNSYQFSDSSNEKEMWLDVEEDDQVEINLVEDVKLPPEVDRKHLDSKKPIIIDNDKFIYDEHGRAQVKIETVDKKWNYASTYYWDYYNEDETKFLSVEMWDNSEIEASVGCPIKNYELDIYPGS